MTSKKAKQQIISRMLSKFTSFFQAKKKSVISQFQKNKKRLSKLWLKLKKNVIYRYKLEKVRVTSFIEYIIHKYVLTFICWSITPSEYDKLYTEFRTKVEETDAKLSNLQKAEDDYYLTSGYLLELANKASELFESSEMEEKRQILKLIVQNPTLDGRIVRYDVLKPFSTILKYADNKLWLPISTYNINIEEIIHQFTLFQQAYSTIGASN